MSITDSIIFINELDDEWDTSLRSGSILSLAKTPSETISLLSVGDKLVSTHAETASPKAQEFLFPQAMAHPPDRTDLEARYGARIDSLLAASDLMTISVQGISDAIEVDVEDEISSSSGGLTMLIMTHFNEALKRASDQELAPPVPATELTTNEDVPAAVVEDVPVVDEGDDFWGVSKKKDKKKKAKKAKEFDWNWGEPEKETTSTTTQHPVDEKPEPVDLSWGSWGGFPLAKAEKAPASFSFGNSKPNEAVFEQMLPPPPEEVVPKISDEDQWGGWGFGKKSKKKGKKTVGEITLASIPPPSPVLDSPPKAEESAKEKTAEPTASSSDTSKISKPPISLKDAVGRKFIFPWKECQTWKGMHGLITTAFRHVDVLAPHVEDGHYDLTNADGVIILPEVWESFVEPNWSLTMHMWPLPEPEPPKLPKLPKMLSVPAPPLPPPPPPMPEFIPLPPPPPPPRQRSISPAPSSISIRHRPEKIYSAADLCPVQYHRFFSWRDEEDSDQVVELVPFDKRAYVTCHQTTPATFKQYLWLLKHADPEQWYRWPGKSQMTQIRSQERLQLPVSLPEGSGFFALQLSVPRVCVTAALTTPLDDNSVSGGTACEHRIKRDDDYSIVVEESPCYRCAEAKAGALAKVGLIYYSVQQTMEGLPPKDQADSKYLPEVHPGTKIFKVVQSGNREEAAAQAFYAAGQSGHSTLFTCVVRDDADLTSIHDNSNVEFVDTLYDLAEEAKDGRVKVYLAKKWESRKIRDAEESETSYV